MSSKWMTAAALVGLGACIVEAPTQAGKESSAPRPPPAPPAEVRSGANFGDMLELTTVGLNPGAARSGDTVRVALNFRVLAAVDRDYMIFVHVEDVDGRVDRINVDHAPRSGPTSQWPPGTMVRDEFEVPIPQGMPVRGLNVIVGLWDPRTDQRMPIKNRDQVRNDGRDRLFVATIPVAQQ